MVGFLPWHRGKAGGASIGRRIAGGLKWAWSAFTWIIEHAVPVTVLSLFVILLGVIWRCVGDQPPVLKPIAVPPSLAQLGITPEVLTNMVEQRVAELKRSAALGYQPDGADFEQSATPPQEGEEEGAEAEKKNNASRPSPDQPLFEPQDEALAKLTLPGTEASLQVLVTIVNRILGNVAPEVEIGVVEQRPAGSGGGATYSYSINVSGPSLSPNHFSSSFDSASAHSYTADSVPEMIDAIAERALWVMDPVAFLHLDLLSRGPGTRLAFSPFASGEMSDESWERLDKYAATKEFLQNCANGVCRVARDQARALLLLAQMARDIGYDFGVTAHIERALKVSYDDVGPSALMAAAEASLRIGDPVQAETWVRPLIVKIAGLVAQRGATEEAHSSDPFHSGLPTSFLRFRLAQAKRIIIQSLLMQMRIEEAKEEIKNFSEIAGFDETRYAGVNNEAVEFHFRVAEEAAKLVAQIRAFRANESDRAALEKNADFNAAVDEIGSLAVATGWPGIATAFEGAAGSGASAGAHASVWNSLLALKRTRNIATVEDTVSRFGAIRVDSTVSMDALGIAEMAIAARSILPAFRTEIVAMHQGITYRRNLLSPNSVFQIVRNASEDHKQFANGLALAAFSTLQVYSNGQFFRPFLTAPDTLRCGPVEDVRSLARDVMQIRAGADSDVISFQRAAPPEMGAEALPVALEALCRQFDGGIDAYYTAARYIASEASYTRALKASDEDGKRQELLSAFEFVGFGASTTGEALLRGKILYQLERYSEASRQLQDVKSVEGVIWMARTQVKLNDPEHAFDNLALAVAYNPAPFAEEGILLVQAILEANTASRVMNEQRLQTLGDSIAWLEGWGIDEGLREQQLVEIGGKLYAALCDLERHTEARSVVLRIRDATGNGELVQKSLKPCPPAAAPK